MLWNTTFTTSLTNSLIVHGFSSMVDFNDTTLVCATPNHLVGINKTTGEIEWEDKMKGWGYPSALYLATIRHSIEWSAAPITYAMHHINMDSN